MWLPKGGDLVLEVHYHLNGKATADRSEVGFYFAREPVSRYVDGVVIGTQDLSIPPGEENYWRRFSMDVPSGMTLTDVTPHMHFLGREFIAIATLPDGSERPLIPHRRLGFPLAEHLHLPGAAPPAGGQPHRRLGQVRQFRGQPAEPGAGARDRDLGLGDHGRDERALDRLHSRQAADRQRIVSASERSWYRPARVSDAEVAPASLAASGLRVGVEPARVTRRPAVAPRPRVAPARAGRRG